MKRTRRWALPLFALILMGSGCYWWTVWDDVFEPDNNPRGWFSGDGAISVPLPPCRPLPGVYGCSSSEPRTLWIFGDTWANYGQTDTYFLDNTIAVQNRQDGEPPIKLTGEITFWASAWDSSAGEYVPRNISWDTPLFSAFHKFNVDGFFLNGEETDPTDNDSRKRWMWGASGVYVPDDGTADGKLVLFYEHWECPNPPPGSECRDANSVFLGERLIIIDNPSAPPNHWQQTHVDIADQSSNPTVGRVRWGVGALYDPPIIYIYGRPMDNDPTTRGELETESIKVASTTIENIADVASWNFLTPDGSGWIEWHRGPPDAVDELQTVAHTAGNIFSVDKIEYEGKTQYVMVHPLPATTHGVLRTSSSPLLWPDFALPISDPTTNQPPTPQSRIDWNGNVAPAGPGVTIGNVAHVEPELAGFARDFRAHPELRGSPTVPSSDLLISYHAEGFEFGESIGKNRFLRWGLTRTYPWCADGDDLSACEYCGNGRREAYEDCDPTAPIGERFDLERLGAAGNTLLCSDYADDFAAFGITNIDLDEPIRCNSYCMADSGVCLPDLECRRDGDCAYGEVCDCASPIECSCTEAGWTAWLDRDNPSATGDYEPIRLHAEEGNSCAAPTAVACRRKSDQLPAALTGEVVRCDTKYGFSCRRDNQPDDTCFDYEVRFYCGGP